MKNWMMYLGMVVVLASLLGNYIVFAGSQLKEPIFFRHYYEVPANPGMMIELNYITNRNSAREIGIAWATIPGTEMMLGPPHELQTHTYTHYLHKSAALELPEYFFDDWKEDSMTLSQLQIYFTNGEMKLVDIGEVILYKPVDPLFDFISSGGSTGNKGFNSLKATENVEITGIDIPFSKDLQSALSIGFSDITENELHKFINSSNPIDYPDAEMPPNHSFPFSVQKEDLLSITYQLAFDENDPNRLNMYDIAIKINGINEEGKSFTEFVPFSYQPYFTEKEIKTIVREAKDD